MTSKQTAVEWGHLRNKEVGTGSITTPAIGLDEEHKEDNTA